MAGQVDGFDPAARVGKRDARKMDLFSQYAVDAADQALTNAGLKAEEGAEAPTTVADPTRFGVILGNGIGGLTTIQDQVIKMHDKGPQRVSPLFVPESIPNMVSGNVSLRLVQRVLIQQLLRLVLQQQMRLGKRSGVFNLVKPMSC